MVSGIDDPITAEQALESGAYRYVVKPFDITELQIRCRMPCGAVTWSDNSAARFTVSRPR